MTLPENTSQAPTELPPGQTICTYLQEEAVPDKTAAECVRSRPDASFPESEEALKLKSLMLWAQIVAEAPSQFQGGKDVLQDQQRESDQFVSVRAEAIEAVIGVKAPSTVFPTGIAIKR